jgi:hypothetical protein
VRPDAAADLADPGDPDRADRLGFWDTFAAILGSVLMILLLMLLLAGLVALGVILVARRLRR